MMTSRRWRPVLDGDLRERAMACAREIASALRVKPHGDDSSLASGSAGHAVVHAHLARAGLERDQSLNASFSCWEHAVDSISRYAGAPSLMAGFVGVAWATESLRHSVLQLGRDPNADIDDFLADFVAQVPWPHAYDLYDGLVGLGVYGLERRADFTAGVLDRLIELAENGETFRTPPRLLTTHMAAQCPAGLHNLGLAHGVPGVVAWLGRMHAAGDSRGDALLERIVPWLLSQAGPEDRPASRYGLCSELDSERGAHLGWCYGDMGVASAIAIAGRALGRSAWSEQAMRLVLRAARIPVADAGLTDAGLCHGTAGLGHMLSRFYNEIGEPALRDAAARWFERTLTLRRPGEGFAGFRAASDGMGDSPETDASLLFGAGGIALALTAASTELEPTWDRFLLLS